jgi:hypothetical protein
MRSFGAQLAAQLLLDFKMSPRGMGLFWNHFV